MARPKKPDTTGMDPMTAAILTGLKPHIDEAVRDQFATILLEVLAKVAPDRLAKTVQTSAPEALPSPPTTGKKGGA